MKQRIEKQERKLIKTKSWFFENVNKIDKHLARLTKEKRKMTQITKIINERGASLLTVRKFKKKIGYTMNNCVTTDQITQMK